MFQLIQTWDEAIMLFIQNFIRNAVCDPIMIALAYMGEAGAVWIAIAVVMLLFKKNRVHAAKMLIALALCFCFNDLVLKYIFQRPRPFLVIEGLTAIVSHPSSFSFPSGHACAGFACAYALKNSFEGKGKWFYVLAVFIALSRPYVGVHYFTDIIVGAIVGTCGSWLLMKLCDKYVPLEKWLNKLPSIK